MKCAELRGMAESYQAGELPVDTNHQIIAHLEGCEDCRVELESRAALRATLRLAFARSSELAPSDQFVARVRATIASQGAVARPAFGMSSRSWLAMAAGLALVATLGWQLGWGPSTTPAIVALAAHAAGDHRNCALNHALDEAPISLDEAARQYGAAYASLRQVVAETSTVQTGDTEIIAAHWCVFDGQRFAHVIVRQHNRVASILLTPVDQARPRRTTEVVSCPATDGFQVACFDAPGHAGFVVSDLTAAQNLDLARSVAPALQAYFART